MWCGDTHFLAMDSSVCTFETQTFHWIFLMQCWGGVITTLKFHTFKAGGGLLFLYYYGEGTIGGGYLSQDGGFCSSSAVIYDLFFV